jgi:hypothetical protein
MIRVLTNLAATELGWFACVAGAANGMPWIGPAVVLVVVALHLHLANRAGPEIRLLVSATLIGLVADSLLVVTGLVSYPSGNWIEGLAPYWILAMWALFATALNVSLKWLRNRTVLAAALGAVGGPLAYLAGEKMGAITFHHSLAAIAALAVIWSVCMPLLVVLAQRMDGVSKPRLPDFVRNDWRNTHHA